MSKRSLERQAERAERLAEQTIDDELKQTFLDAAREYREQAKRESEEHAIPTEHPPTWMDLGSSSPEQPKALTGF